MQTPLDMIETIARKRDGGQLPAATIAAFVHGLAAGRVPDYQASALLMAIYLRGLDTAETVALTRAITDSGRRLDFSDLGPVVDKHSTGGVGDTVSLVAGPLAAACGVVVPMISGRALGHTGGTLDKLEAIPGLCTRLEPAAFRSAVAAAGIAIVEAGPELAPGDARLYRLRDASATVAEPGLITASILGKKLCVSPRGLVMDLKSGRGSFVGNRAAARRLGERMGAVARELGLATRFLITDMQRPLSPAVGNAVEIEHTIHILRGAAGHGSATGDRLLSLSLTLAGEMIALAGLAASAERGRQLAAGALDRGDGLQRFRRMIEAQDGDPRVADDPRRLPSPRVSAGLAASRAGFVAELDAALVGQAAARLGTARGAVGAEVDPAAGLRLEVEIGDAVEAGDRLATLGAADSGRLQAAMQLLATAVRVAETPPAGPSGTDPVLERLPAGAPDRPPS